MHVALVSEREILEICFYIQIVTPFLFNYNKYSSIKRTGIPRDVGGATY